MCSSWTATRDCSSVSSSLFPYTQQSLVHTYIHTQIHVDGKFLQLSLNYCTQHLVAYIQTNKHKYRKVTLHTINRCWRKLRRKLSYAYTAIPYSKYIHIYIHYVVTISPVGIGERGATQNQIICAQGNGLSHAVQLQSADKCVNVFIRQLDF